MFSLFFPMIKVVVEFFWPKEAIPQRRHFGGLGAVAPQGKKVEKKKEK